MTALNHILLQADEIITLLKKHAPYNHKLNEGISALIQKRLAGLDEKPSEQMELPLFHIHVQPEQLKASNTG